MKCKSFDQAAVFSKSSLSKAIIRELLSGDLSTGMPITEMKKLSNTRLINFQVSRFNFLRRK